MNIFANYPDGERRTAADVIFEQLRQDIVNLRILPGAKLSEVEIAGQHDVSRQPVREAFIRLSNMKLLQVRPQRATLVRKISNLDILNSRFIRTAVEVEVAQKACISANPGNLVDIEGCLSRQRKAVQANDSALFHDLDYEFHYLLSVAANCAFAFKTIAENKSHVDRLCLLSLASAESKEELLDDHTRIFEALEKRNSEDIVALTRKHLSRLDATVADARKKFPDYFED